MANIKSQKKRTKTNKKRQVQNKARKGEIKTYTKKFLTALKDNDITLAKDLFKVVESKISRAKGKNVLKANTASRKTSRLARLFSAAMKNSTAT